MIKMIKRWLGDVQPGKHRVRFATATLSDPGGRAGNEDCLAWQAATGGELCWVVADGLGGHYGGEIASQTAVQAFMDSFSRKSGPVSAELLMAHLQTAHAAVLTRQQDDPSLMNMRTTFVAMLSDGITAWWAHIGDSRLYGFRGGGELVVQTKDHSVPQAMVDAGEIKVQDIRCHEDRNRLLRDMGGPKAFRPTVLETPWALRAGDAFLLCTDGFWEPISETEMAAELVKAPTPEDWLRGMAYRIKKNLYEGHDNYTAIAIFVV